ncbi:MAG: hypothetical protein IPM99_07215 [Rubrivivax sp.]|nr:hypothetical protein [Rubrivivax sp.]
MVGANIIFSSAHLYVSTGLAVTAFVAGLFWAGCMRASAGWRVSVSHILLSFWAFEVDLGCWSDAGAAHPAGRAWQ